VTSALERTKRVASKPGRQVHKNLRRMTFEEFLTWDSGEIVAEWVAGEVVRLSPNDSKHQSLLGFLHSLLREFVLERGLGQVYVAGMLMRLPTRPSGRVPDLLFLAEAHLGRLHETYVDGPADLVVEIVSPESDARDHGEKFVEYEGAGVPEYWLVDLLRNEARFNVVDERGRYRLATVPPDGIYESTVLPGFRLRVDWLWQNRLPTVSDARHQVGM
jgi:Uma2 family endonuclease